MSTIDLSRIPAPKIIDELSFEQIRDEMLASLPAEYAAGPADPAYKSIEIGAYREVLLRVRINESVKQSLLPFAEGTNLENLAALFNTEKQPNSEGEPESDESLRQRALEAFDSKTTAGSKISYEKHVKDILGEKLFSVNAYSPNPGEVILPVQFSGLVDDEDKAGLLRKLEREIEDLRPITDKVEIREARFLFYDFKATVFVLDGVDRELLAEDLSKRVRAYLKDRSRVSVGVPKSGALSACHQNSRGEANPSVERAEVTFSVSGIEFDNIESNDDISAILREFSLEVVYAD
ncbi:MAG: baseplate J/gp47 family protein [Pseudobacteriovorax sp.]|nr:baseplate J/gp47 family protein [Pseudobacteriovorax sp.]